MAALTANRKRHVRALQFKETVKILGVDSDEFYEGGLVNWSAAASTVVPASDTASQRFAGVCVARVTTAGSNTTKIELERGHQEWFPHTGLAAGQEGANAIVSDDQTVTDAAGATNDVPIGEIMEFETIDGTAGVWVKIGHYAPSNA